MTCYLSTQSQTHPWPSLKVTIHSSNAPLSLMRSRPREVLSNQDGISLIPPISIRADKSVTILNSNLMRITLEKLSQPSLTGWAVPKVTRTASYTKLSHNTLKMKRRARVTLLDSLSTILEIFTNHYTLPAELTTNIPREMLAETSSTLLKRERSRTSTHSGTQSSTNSQTPHPW